MKYYVLLVDFTLKQLRVFQDVLAPIRMQRINFYDDYVDCYIEKPFFDIWMNKKLLDDVLKILKNNHIEIWYYNKEEIAFINTIDKDYVIDCYYSSDTCLKKMLLLLNTEGYTTSIVSNQRWGSGYLTIIKLDRLLEQEILDIFNERYDYDTFLIDKNTLVYQVWC